MQGTKLLRAAGIFLAAAVIDAVILFFIAKSDMDFNLATFWMILFLFAAVIIGLLLLIAGIIRRVSGKNKEKQG